MRTIFQSLAWKEWHEHKWKLASLVAILCGVTLLFLLDLERGTLIGIQVGLIMGITPLAIFIGLGTAAGERSRGTLQFLQSLPIPMWRVALHKVAFGLVTILVPALMTVALVLIWLMCLDVLGIEYRAASDLTNYGDDKNTPFLITASWSANTVLMVTLVGASFFAWTIAAGVNRKDEVSAGAVALTVITAWCALQLLAWGLCYKWHGPFSEWPSVPGKWLAVTGLATAPGGLLTVFDAANGVWQYIVLACCVAPVTSIMLATWYIRRFGRISNLEIRSPKTATIGAGPLDWLGPPRRSPFTAIAWKQFRESGPLALVGVAIVIGTVAVILIVDWTSYSKDVGRMALTF